MASFKISIAFVYERRTNSPPFNASNLSFSSGHTLSVRKSTSYSHVSCTYSATNFTIASATSMSPARSQNAISGSIIQNSAAWRAVLEFSARKVGPKVYTFEKAMANVSTSSWPDTVSAALFPKKSLERSVSPGARVVTLNMAPAPSQSEPVIMGVWTYTKPRSLKNLWIANAACERMRNTAPNRFVLGRRCAISRRNSGEWRFFCRGYDGREAPSTATSSACSSKGWRISGVSTTLPRTRRAAPTPQWTMVS